MAMPIEARGNLLSIVAALKERMDLIYGDLHGD
jgi:hypothetical protein